MAISCMGHGMSLVIYGHVTSTTSATEHFFLMALTDMFLLLLSRIVLDVGDPQQLKTTKYRAALTDALHQNTL